MDLLMDAWAQHWNEHDGIPVMVEGEVITEDAIVFNKKVGENTIHRYTCAICNKIIEVREPIQRRLELHNDESQSENTE